MIFDKKFKGTIIYFLIVDRFITMQNNNNNNMYFGNFKFFSVPTYYCNNITKIKCLHFIAGAQSAVHFMYDFFLSQYLSTVNGVTVFLLSMEKSINLKFHSLLNKKKISNNSFIAGRELFYACVLLNKIIY